MVVNININILSFRFFRYQSEVAPLINEDRRRAHALHRHESQESLRLCGGCNGKDGLFLDEYFQKKGVFRPYFSFIEPYLPRAEAFVPRPLPAFNPHVQPPAWATMAAVSTGSRQGALEAGPSGSGILPRSLSIATTAAVDPRLVLSGRDSSVVQPTLAIATSSSSDSGFLTSPQEPEEEEETLRNHPRRRLFSPQIVSPTSRYETAVFASNTAKRRRIASPLATSTQAMQGEPSHSRDAKGKSIFKFRTLLPKGPEASDEGAFSQAVGRNNQVGEPSLIKKASRLSGFPLHVADSAPRLVHSINGVDVYEGPIYDVPLNPSDTGEGSESEEDTLSYAGEESMSAPLATPLPTSDPSPQKENADPLPSRAEKKWGKTTLEKTTPALRPDPEIGAQDVNAQMRKPKERRRAPLAPANGFVAVGKRADNFVKKAQTAQSASASPVNTMPALNVEVAERSDLSLPVTDLSAIHWENLTSSFASSSTKSPLAISTFEQQAQMDDSFNFCAQQQVEASEVSVATKAELIAILTDSDGEALCHSQIKH